MTFFTPYICTDQEETLRQAKDLVYEAMKMRTGNWKTWDRNRFEIVGGGILEKKMLEQGGMIAEEALEGLQYESRGNTNNSFIQLIIHASTYAVFLYSRNAMLWPTYNRIMVRSQRVSSLRIRRLQKDWEL